MPIKTNQEKATEDTHKRIKKKVKKIKKRIRKNATLTPQVARNTRGDANKYAPYPQFAYRPADSPTHILKTKNDLVKIINQDIHNERLRSLELETDISRLQHQRYIAIKRNQELETTKRKKLKEKLQAEHDEQLQKYSYDQYKKDELHKHQRALLEMKLEAEKSIFDQELANKRELLDIETQQRKDKLGKERALAIRQAQLRGQENTQQHKFNNYKEAIDRFKWEGMYHDPTIEDNGRRRAKGNVKQGAQQLLADGIEFRYGERELIEQRRNYEMEKLIRETQREQDDLKHELSKYTTLKDAINDPLRKQLEERLAKQKRAYEQLQILSEKNKESDKLRKEIRDLEHKAAVLKASNQPPNETLIKQRNDKLSEFGRARQERDARLEMMKLERQIAEMKAQTGEVGTLDQELKEKREQMLQYKEEMKKLSERRQLEKKLKRQIDKCEEEREELREVAGEFVNGLAWSSQIKHHLDSLDDPLRQMDLMMTTLQQDISQSQTIRDKAYELAKELDFRPNYRHDDDNYTFEQGDYS